MRPSWWMLAALAACTGSDPDSYVARDPCAALSIIADATTAIQRDGIADAFVLWQARGVAAFDPLDGPLDGPGATPAIDQPIAIRFDAAGSVFHGAYDPVAHSVVINREIVDRRTLAIVIAHELGHVFGLAHVAATSRVSLMNPGNLVTPPTDGDQRALEALWGACR